jgi:hypothetical protein
MGFCNTTIKNKQYKEGFKNMGEDNKSNETRLAVIETDIRYIKESLKDMANKINGLDAPAPIEEKQNERISAFETEIAVLKSKITLILWVLGIVGSTAIAALTTSLLKVAAAAA